MNAKRVVKLSNAICLISVILLVYWVFTFIIMQVFGLKIFKENITQTFYFSILAIITLMTGALITNIMFNLTRIAEKHNNDSTPINKNSRVQLICFVLSFPVIVSLLFIGNNLTAKKKENILKQSAESIIQSNQTIINSINGYTFTKDWIQNTQDMLELLSKLDSNYRKVTLIIKDEISDTPVYLEFGSYNNNSSNNPQKIDYILKTNLKTREYLEKVYNKNKIDMYFSSIDGNYELFYPIKKGNNIIVLYFQDNQQYGKIGS